VVGLRQDADGAARAPRAAEEDALAAEAPHAAAAGGQAAGLPARRPASPSGQRVPTQADDAAPVHPQHSAGHPAQICGHTWTESEGKGTQWWRKLFKKSVAGRHGHRGTEKDGSWSWNGGDGEDKGLVCIGERV